MSREALDAAKRRRDAARRARAEQEAGVSPRQFTGTPLTPASQLLDQLGPDFFQCDSSPGNQTNEPERTISCRDLSTMEQVEGTFILDDRVPFFPGIGRDIPGDGVGRPDVRDDILNGGGGSGGNSGGNTDNITDPNEDAARRNADEAEDLFNQIGQSGVSQDNLPQLISDFTDSPFLSLGREAIIANRQDYGNTFNNITTDYKLELPFIEDKIKYYNGSFYILFENNSLKFYSNIINAQENFTYIKTPRLNSNQNNIENISFKFNTNYLPLPNSGQRSSFISKFINGGTINTFLPGMPTRNNYRFSGLINNTTPFQDNTFTMQLPFENTELLSSLNLFGASIVDLKQKYNFYLKEYERFANSQYNNAHENTLPNIYLLDLMSEDTEQQNNNENMAILNSMLPSGLSAASLNRAKELFDIKDQSEQFFDSFSFNYPNISNQVKDFIKIKNENIIFLLDTTKKLNEISKKKSSFPMYTEFTIPVDKTTNVSKALIDTGLIDNFMIQLCGLYKQRQFNSIESVVCENIFSQSLGENQISTVEQSFSSKIKFINYINIENMLNSLKEEPIPNNNSYIVIGDLKNSTRTNSGMNTFVNTLKSIIFKGKLNTLASNNKRTYLDILNNKKCYNETVAFRVSKYYPNTDTPIQNYWIPNNPDLDVINLIDTQVKYEQEYIYKIFAYQFVLGNSIKHVSGIRQNLDGFNINVENILQKNLMEIEIFSSSRTIRDTPPLSPEIEFVPYIGVDNKIGLFLNSRTGEEKLQPINILPQDSEKTISYIKDINNLVLYKTDDLPGFFEIFRLDKKPKSYSDFSVASFKSIDPDTDKNTSQTASTAAFIDSIKPNKKYYYCFRTVDVHGKISNPSAVFEVEMINENGMIYPIIKNYEFEKPAYNNNLEVRRFIKISPASQHTYLNQELSDIANDTTAEDSKQKIKLGLSNVAVPWAKTFKMVVTSKQTGKKCEFKFKFKDVKE